MIRLAADEDLNDKIVKGLLRETPDLDIVRVRQAGLSGASDPEVLEWAAQEERVLFTHDVNTMIAYAQQRISAGDHMPGLFAVSRKTAISSVIDHMLLIASCSRTGEYDEQIGFLPL